MNRSAQLIGRLKVGRNSLDLAHYNRRVFSYLNGPCVTESKSEKDFTQRTAPVLAMMIDYIHQEPEEISFFRKNGSYNQLLDDFLKEISRKLEDVEVRVLEMKPDEITENKPAQIQASKIFSGLQGYYKDLREIEESVKDTKELSGALLRTDLPKAMWGSKEVSSVLNGIRNDMGSLSEDFEKFEASMERTDENMRRFLIMTKQSDQPNVRESVRNIVERFQGVKEFVSMLIQTLYNLYDIDSVFKKNTKYPATWFFNSSVFYDFLYNFENLVKKLIRLSNIETNVIEPILLKTGE